MNPSVFLIAHLLLGLAIAAWILASFGFDDEFRREIERDTGLGLVPSGPAVFAVLVLVISSLFPAAGFVGLVRWLLGLPSRS